MLSPATLAEGILGLEGEHVANGLVLNQQGVLPRYKIDRITGLHDLPDADDNRDAGFSRFGELVYPSMPRGKTVVYEGRTMARTLPELRTMQQALRTALGDRSNQLPFQVRPPAARGGVEWVFGARVIALSEDDEQATSPHAVVPWQRAWSLSIRQADPRYYSSEVVTVGDDGGTYVNVQNFGSAPTEPIFVLRGPWSGPTYRVQRFDPGGTVDDSGAQLEFTPSTDFNDNIDVVVDFGRRIIYRTNAPGKDIAAKITSVSDWWDARPDQGIPGGGVIYGIRCLGCDTWEATFRHASW